MNEKEIAFLLLKDGIRNYQINPGTYIETGENPGLIERSSNTIEVTLEFLAKKELVTDFLPTYGQYGHGFAYRINSELSMLSDDELHRKLNLIIETRDNIISSLNELIAELNLLNQNASFKEYVFRTIDELKISFSSGCFVSCRLICEQLTETALLKFLDDNKTTLDYSGILRNPLFLKYFDQRLTEKGEIINKNRSLAQGKVKFSIPTEHQAAMEILKVIDALKNILKKSAAVRPSCIGT